VDIARSKAATLYGLVILILVCVSLFSRRIPVPIQSILFLVVLLLEITMIMAGWWYCVRNKSVNGVPNWRLRMALLGAIANTVAFAIPVGSLVYMMFYPAIARYTHTPMINAELMIVTCLAFSLCGVIAGTLSPPRNRFATTLGSLIIAMLILAIPMGVL
jgi:hypothetical protein